MNRNAILCKAALAAAFLLVLPQSALAKTHWYQPHLLASVEEASNRLEFFSPHFAPVSQAMGYDTLTTGYSLERVDVNKLGINLSFTKSGVNVHSQYFWGWNGGYNAPVSTPYKDDIVTQIVYADVSYIEISHNDKAIGYPATWCVNFVSRGPRRNSSICVSSEEDSHGLADALATLVVASGGNVGTSSGMGIAQPSERDLKKHPEQAGLEVKEVNLESPPAQAGIQEKDVIRAVNGQVSTDREVFFKAISEITKQPGGGVVHLDILRKNKPLSLEVYYPFVEQDVERLRQQAASQGGRHGAVPVPDAAPAAPPQGVRFGFQVRAVKEADVAVFGLAKARGIVVLDVSKGGLADVMGFLSGDVILEMNNSEIGDLELFTQFARSGAVKSFRVWRKGQALELTVPQSL